MSTEPLAEFVVERQPGQGYRVTFSRGPEAERLRERAIRLLDELGQPDPKGPEEICRWLGPIGPGGEFVSVTIKRLPSGEVSYRQSWFRGSERAVLPGSRWRVALVAVLLAFFGGGYLGWSLHLKHGNPLPPAGNGSAQQPPQLPIPLPDPSADTLRVRIRDSKEVLANLKKFLEQKGLAAKPNAAVVEPKRAVRLLSDLDFGAVAQNEVRLFNTEVRSLLDLFDAIDRWDRAVATKP